MISHLIGVIFNIKNSNSIYLLHLNNKVTITGGGTLKFREDSFVKKVSNGDKVYNYIYNNNYLINEDKSIFEGTNGYIIGLFKVKETDDEEVKDYILSCYPNLRAYSNYLQEISVSKYNDVINQLGDTMIFKRMPQRLTHLYEKGKTKTK